MHLELDSASRSSMDSVSTCEVMCHDNTTPLLTVYVGVLSIRRVDARDMIIVFESEYEYHVCESPRRMQPAPATLYLGTTRSHNSFILISKGTQSRIVFS